MAMPKLVKRCAGTRLYDTEAARYMTLAELRARFAQGAALIVVDAETGQDITQALAANALPT
jgi:polyhydroxyalkanoate synthesis regulator protein